jgi:cation/acetate symporter
LSVTGWTYVFVIATFGLYIAIAFASRVRSTSGFYVAGRGVSPLANGMATAADWMSAASFISMAGLISFIGYDGTVYLMGWTGGYVLLALLLAPYLRKYGKFTIPEFVGDRYYSQTARLVAAVAAIFVSFTYVCGQMQGVGIVFSRFLELSLEGGVAVGMLVVIVYAVLGGMRGITYTQVAQYVVLIAAYLIPAAAISYKMTGHFIPQIGFGSTLIDGPSAGLRLLEAIDQIHTDLGFPDYTAAFVDGKRSMIDIGAITLALMAGTAGLPHVLIRFYTTPSAQSARWSALYALIFIGVLYTTAPAVATFARVNLIQALDGTAVERAPEWFHQWRATGLIAFEDRDGDGRIRYRAGAGPGEAGDPGPPPRNELTVNRDIIVLASPEMAGLPAWVIALVAAGGLAAALSTAAGLLLVMSSSISHDVWKSVFKPDMTDAQELLLARCVAAVAVLIAGYFGVNPPGFVGEVVAFAFGLAASSFFPVLVLGVFSGRTSMEGAIAGMITGLAVTAGYIVYFRLIAPELGADAWWLGISPLGIGSVGMVLNFAVTIAVSAVTRAPPEHVRAMVEQIRLPSEVTDREEVGRVA